MCYLHSVLLNGAGNDYFDRFPFSVMYSNCKAKVFETTDSTDFHRYFFDNHKFSLKIFIQVI